MLLSASKNDESISCVAVSGHRGLKVNEEEVDVDVDAHSLIGIHAVASELPVDSVVNPSGQNEQLDDIRADE